MVIDPSAAGRVAFRIRLGRVVRFGDFQSIPHCEENILQRPAWVFGQIFALIYQEG